LRAFWQASVQALLSQLHQPTVGGSVAAATMGFNPFGNQAGLGQAFNLNQLLAVNGGINPAQAALLAGNPLFTNPAQPGQLNPASANQLDIQGLLGGAGVAGSAGSQLGNPLLLNALGGAGATGGLAGSLGLGGLLDGQHRIAGIDPNSLRLNRNLMGSINPQFAQQAGAGNQIKDQLQALLQSTQNQAATAHQPTSLTSNNNNQLLTSLANGTLGSSNEVLNTDGTSVLAQAQLLLNSQNQTKQIHQQQLAHEQSSNSSSTGQGNSVNELLMQQLSALNQDQQQQQQQQTGGSSTGANGGLSILNSMQKANLIQMILGTNSGSMNQQQLSLLSLATGIPLNTLMASNQNTTNSSSSNNQPQPNQANHNPRDPTANQNQDAVNSAINNPSSQLTSNNQLNSGNNINVALLTAALMNNVSAGVPNVSSGSHLSDVQRLSNDSVNSGSGYLSSRGSTGPHRSIPGAPSTGSQHLSRNIRRFTPY